MFFYYIYTLADKEIFINFESIPCYVKTCVMRVQLSSPSDIRQQLRHLPTEIKLIDESLFKCSRRLNEQLVNISDK
jgi:hypothetical protein